VAFAAVFQHRQHMVLLDTCDIFLFSLPAGYPIAKAVNFLVAKNG